MNRIAFSSCRPAFGLAILAIVLAQSACTSLPPAIPEAIGLAGQRIELNAVTARRALTALVDNAEVSRKQITAAKNELSQIAASLSESDKTHMHKAKHLLDEAAMGLRPTESVISVRDEIKPRLESTASALKQIQAILAERVDQEQILETVVKRLREAISRDN